MADFSRLSELLQPRNPESWESRQPTFNRLSKYNIYYYERGIIQPEIRTYDDLHIYLQNSY